MHFSKLQMSNYYAPCFYRIDFVVIPSYIELPCMKIPCMKRHTTETSFSLKYVNGSITETRRDKMMSYFHQKF